MENKFLKLTNYVYKVLEFFPESDPLKNRAKDKALVIMENLILINETSGWASFQKEKVKTQLFEDIDILLGYLWIGKTQGWLNSSNCLIISNEYEKIKNGINPIVEIIPKMSSGPIIQHNFVETENLENDKKEAELSADSVRESAQKPVSDNIIDDKELSAKALARQKKIIEFLSNNGKAQVMDLQTILPDITKRTIRRDLDDLLAYGKIIRLGEFNQIFYKISEIGHN